MGTTLQMGSEVIVTWFLTLWHACDHSKFCLGRGLLGDTKYWYPVTNYCQKVLFFLIWKREISICLHQFLHIFLIHFWLACVWLLGYLAVVEQEASLISPLWYSLQQNQAVLLYEIFFLYYTHTGLIPTAHVIFCSLVSFRLVRLVAINNILVELWLDIWTFLGRIGRVQLYLLVSLHRFKHTSHISHKTHWS